MTFTHKLARRLARLRPGPALLLPLLAACAAGEPTSISPDNPPIDAATDGPVALSPRTVTLEGSQGVVFRAFESLIPSSSQVTSIEWTTTGGTIDAGGSYTPTSTGSFKVVGRRRGNPHNPPDTAVVVVVPPQPTLVAIDLTPSTATVGGGLQQQFSVVGRQSDGTEVPVGVTWTATGGTIDAGGLFTAGRTAGTYKVSATHVTTGLADTATVTVPPATLTSITLSPGSASLGAGQAQQFSVTGRLSDGTTASVPAAFTATGGSISVSGYYTAGSTAGTFRVIATAQGGLADTSAVTITAPTAASVLWNGDLESGVWPSGSIIQACEPDRVQIYSVSNRPAGAPAPRRGTRAAAFRVLNTDVEPCTPSENPRAQVLSPPIFRPGDETWSAFSVFIPDGLPSCPGFFLFEEDYGPPYGGTPPSAWYIAPYNGVNHVELTGDYDPALKDASPIWHAPLVTGVWNDVLMHKRYATDQTGWIEGWLNGEPMIFPGNKTRLYGQTMLTGSTYATFILAQYRKLDCIMGEQTIYFDEAKVGTTRASVEIPRDALLATR